MTTSEVVAAIGRAAREAARGDGPASEFSRGQLMSAFSASRHLAVELARFPAELHSYADEIASLLRAPGNVRDPGTLVELAAELAGTTAAPRIGDLLAVALDTLRDDCGADAAVLRTRLHAALRRLSDREVALLAEAIEGASA
jgi:hypothetical protein